MGQQIIRRRARIKTPAAVQSAEERRLERVSAIMQPFNGAIDVLYEDADVAVLNKQAGVVVIPERHHPHPDTLTNRLWYFLWRRDSQEDPARREEFQPRLVHRLDRDTSGVILFARNARAQRMLTEQFENHRVVKTYLALVDGIPEPRNGRIDLPIGPPPKLSHSTRGRMFINTPQAKDAVTDYRVLEQGEGWALVEARPRTGRTHQVRLHLSSIGYPLMVDPLYGSREAIGSNDLFGRRLGQSDETLMTRLTLHAASLTFQSVPSEGRPSQAITVEAPLPADFQRLLQRLRKKQVEA